MFAIIICESEVLNMLHLSDVKKLERCKRYFWLSRREKKDQIPYINYNENMTELVKQRLGITDCFEGHPNDDAHLAYAAYTKKTTLVNARFSYREMRITIPVLLQKDGKTILYMTYKNCFPREREIAYIAALRWILETYHIKVDQIYAIHLNASYIRGAELDVDELFIITDKLYNAKKKAHKTILEQVTHVKCDMDSLIDELLAVEALEEIAPKRTTACTRGSKCPYYEECFFENVADNSVLHLLQSSHKFEMYHEGIQNIADVDVNRIEGTRHQYAQIMAAKGNGRYVDKSALRCWQKDHIAYPISYLDFEWETYAFPPYQGMKPYDVLVFQYSQHVEEKGSDHLLHNAFIGEKDCREAFILDLLAHVPKQGSILVYNMEGAEKLRLLQLGQQFPQYAHALQKIWERMVDLSLPFSAGNVYDKRMKGSYSLKTLVSLFSSYDYKKMAISDGMKAVEKWRMYTQTMDAQEKKLLYEQLNAYCSMDTYAEYIIYHALCDMAGV